MQNFNICIEAVSEAQGDFLPFGTMAIMLIQWMRNCSNKLNVLSNTLEDSTFGAIRR
ncbi:MAG TPA: hypothetical protein V6D12_20635 [Candidatus Obscuribacterales bacterium]